MSMRASFLPGVACLAVLVGMAACAAVAGLDQPVRPVGDRPADLDDSVDATRPQADAGRASDAAGDVSSDTADDESPPSACACAPPRQACCIPSGGAGASCIATEAGTCIVPGSLLLGCVRPGANGRDCCWNAAGTATSYAPGCAVGRSACVADVDCLNSTCAWTECKGVLIGACSPGQKPTCPP